MELPPLALRTSATVELAPYIDLDGARVAIALVKQRFAITRRGTAVREPGASVHFADQPWDPDAPETSTIKYPCDVCLRKPSTDVIVVGSAMSYARRAQRELMVSVRVGKVARAIRVLGPRRWRRGVMGMALSEPSPFTEMSIRWENAWGGADYTTDPERPLEEPRNPSGRGVARVAAALEGELGPSIEDPSDPITRPRAGYTPAGLGAIGRHFAPRRDYRGTYDDAWREERMPLLPLDFDPRFDQAAPPELVAPEPLKGGEPVEIENMNDDGPIRFALPKLRFFAGLQTRDRMSELRVQLDTVLIEPNERALTMTWRALARLPRHPRDVRFVQVHEKEIV